MGTLLDEAMGTLQFRRSRGHPPSLDKKSRGTRDATAPRATPPLGSLGDSRPAIPTPRAEPGAQHRTDPPCVLILGAQGTNSRCIQCFGHTRDGGEDARTSELDRQLPSLPSSDTPSAEPGKC